MHCSKCGGDTKVIDSEEMGDQRKRRRECLKCTYRFTTVEIYGDGFEAWKKHTHDQLLRKLTKEILTKVTEHILDTMDFTGKRRDDGPQKKS